MIITAGKFKGQKVIAPDGNITRPTLSKVRMSVFNTLFSIIVANKIETGRQELDADTLLTPTPLFLTPDASFLDMYAGSGIMGLEALSRGFAHAAFIEQNPKVMRVLKSNLSAHAPLSTILHGDAIKLSAKLTTQFDVIYVDPPYAAGIYEQSLAAVKNIAAGIVILEHTTPVDYTGYTLIKQKKYGDKFITFLE
jgi:16S rRNA G966 N2-methylase RsmD